MKTIDYYFIKEYQWKKVWFSELGILKASIMPTNDFINKNGYINFSILSSIFSSDRMLKDINWVDELIKNIQKVLNGELEITGTYCETESLEIRRDFSRPIDNLDMHGSNPSNDTPNSWNVTTPIELQYIPTEEILQLFIDWKLFLEEQKNKFV